MLYSIRIFFITILLSAPSFAPIMAMQNRKKTASAELVVQNNSAKLVALNAFHPPFNRMITQHIMPNNKNFGVVFLDEKQPEGADLWTYASIFAATIKGKYDRFGIPISADAVIRRFEAVSEVIKTTELWLRDIPGTGGKIIATVNPNGSISLALAQNTP